LLVKEESCASLGTVAFIYAPEDVFRGSQGRVSREPILLLIPLAAVKLMEM
jgi:hypothetical protein